MLPPASYAQNTLCMPVTQAAANSGPVLHQYTDMDLVEISGSHVGEYED
jgi:hypothetical protein